MTEYSRQEIKHVEEVLDFFKVFSKDKRFEECKPMILEKAKKGAVNMCTVMDFAEKQGIEQGARKQACETAQKMLKAGEPTEKIVEYTGLSMEEVKKLAEQA